MLVLKVEKEIKDSPVYKTEIKNGNYVTQNTYYPQKFILSDGKLVEIVAGDSIVNEILNLLKTQDENKSGLINEVTRDNIKLKKKELAKEQLKNMDKSVLNLLKKQYNENKSLGGSLSKYDNFFDCYVDYYM